MSARFWLGYTALAVIVAVLVAFFPRELIVSPKEGSGVAAMFDYSQGEVGTAGDSRSGALEVGVGSGKGAFESSASSVVDFSSTNLVSDSLSIAFEDSYLIRVEGPRDLAVVKKNIALNLVSFRYWYIQSSYDIVDTVVISFEIKQNGFVQGVAIDSGSTLDTIVKVQLINQIEQFQFYQIDVAGLTRVHYPLRFLRGKTVL